MNLKYCWSVWSVLVQAVRPSGYQLSINKYAQWPASLLWTLWRNFKFVTATFWFALVSLILIFRLNFLTAWHAVWSEFLRTWKCVCRYVLRTFGFIASSVSQIFLSRIPRWKGALFIDFSRRPSYKFRFVSRKKLLNHNFHAPWIGLSSVSWLLV